jgi:hypothetical protein
MAKPIPLTIDPAKFWRLVEISDITQCWPWKLRTNDRGYGCVSTQGDLYKSHRVAYTLIRGSIPDGLVLDHLCRNRSCCNPWHLEAVTHAENVRRGAAMKRPRGSSVHGSTTGYAYGCRCDQCRTASAEYTLAYRQSKPPRPRRQRTLVHGTTSGYSYGCRCVPCREAKAEQGRAYRARYVKHS